MLQTTDDLYSSLGKKAASLYLNKQAPDFNEAVIRVISDQDLTTEQIRRITENANQAAWSNALVKGKPLSTFDMADAEVVIGALSRTWSHEQANTDELADFSSPEEIGPLPTGELDDLLSAMSPVDAEVEKTSSRSISSADLQEALYMAQTAEQVRDQFLHDARRLEGELVELREKFYGLVKEAHLMDGIPISDILLALNQVITMPKTAAREIGACVQRLRNGGVEIDDSDLAKMGSKGRIVNSDHPLLVTYTVLEKTAAARVLCGRAAEHSHKKAHRAYKFLRDHVRGP